MKLNQFIAACFATIGFAVSILAGIHADNGFETVVLRALAAALGCYVVGYAVGVVAGFVAREHAQRIAANVADADAAERTRKEQAAAEVARKAAADALPGIPAT